MALSKDAAIERIGGQLLTSAMRVHSVLGPGVLESAYEACLAYEIGKAGLKVDRQVALPIEYDGQRLEAGYRLDLLVEQVVVVEVKAVEKLMPIHMAQVISYLKLGAFPVRFLLNFHVVHLRHGIKRNVA